ncbi:MAG: riboflavin synthase, partial [Myxococcota bacterium]
LGGHLVMGHVDEVGHIRGLQKRQNAWDIRVSAPTSLLKLIIPRGSVAVDGISLTVTDRDRETFSLSIIPHTWAVTSMASLKVGDPVNLEADVIARYVEGLLTFDAPSASGGLTEAVLKKHGF